MPVTHTFTSPKSDGADATLVRPSNWNASHTVTTLDVPQTLALSGDITATTLSGNVNDWAPTGLATASIIRADAGGVDRNITGLTGGSDGRVIVIENIGASNDLLLLHDQTSTAANRFLGINGATTAITVGASVVLIYDATASRWRVMQNIALSTTPPSAIGTASAGVATSAASKRDHVHATGAGTPTTQAFGDAATTGSGPAAAMTDHKHAMPVDPVTAHAAAGDPHTGYATDTDLTNHAAAADPHTGYVLESLVNAKGDLIVATADNTVTRRAIGSNDEILMADSAQADGLKWAASAAPAAETFGAAQAIGTTDTFARGDHVHAMPADPVTNHAAAADPHTGYVLESLFNAKGDLITASAADTPSLLTVGANDTILMADSAAGGGLKWAASAAPAAETFGAAQTTGTADTFARGDHVHAMPADPVTAHAAAADPHTGYLKETDNAVSIDFSQGGGLSIGAGAFRWYNDTGRTLNFASVRASVGTAPTGAAILVDVNKNGTTIFTTQSFRPSIAVSTNTAETLSFDVGTVSDGQYLTIDIDQVGSTIAGSDLTVQVWMSG